MDGKHVISNDTDNEPTNESVEESRRGTSEETLEISEEALLRFLPPDYPRVYEDGRVPLRVQVFNNKSILYSVISKPKKGVFMCNHCDNSFAGFGELLDHFDQFDINRPFKCEVDDCPWRIVGFNKTRQLQRHIASVHSERIFKCEIAGCNKMFKRMDLLSRHTKSVHDNKSSRFNKKLWKTPPSTSDSTSLENFMDTSEIGKDSSKQTFDSMPSSSRAQLSEDLSAEEFEKKQLGLQHPDDIEKPISTDTNVDVHPGNQPKRVKYEPQHYRYSIEFLTHKEDTGDLE